MRILHVVESFATGTLEFIRQIVIGLPQYSHIIYYAERELPIHKAKELFPNEVTFIKWNFAQREINIKLDFLAGRHLYDLLSNNDFDVIHLHSSKAGFIGRIVCSCSNYNRVIYSPNGVSFARKDIPFIKKFIFKLLEFLANKFAGQVVAVSKSECDILRKIGVNSVYINNGVIIKNNPKGSKNGRKLMRIVTMGRVSEQKNPTLFNQIAQHYSSQKNIEFIWIGEGNLRNKLTSTNIKVTGWVNQVEVKNILENADLYLSSSLWEGLPFSVLEAMQNKIPLLLTNCVGNCDLVEVGFNGYLFEKLQSAIKYIDFYIDNEEIRVRDGLNSFEILKKQFNSEQMVFEYMSLYNLTTINYENCNSCLSKITNKY